MSNFKTVLKYMFKFVSSLHSRQFSILLHVNSVRSLKRRRPYEQYICSAVTSQKTHTLSVMKLTRLTMLNNYRFIHTCNKPTIAQFGQILLVKCVAPTCFDVCTSSSGSPCSLLSYFTILFKLICYSLCIQCL
jgi:hypothetical protein